MTNIFGDILTEVNQIYNKPIETDAYRWVLNNVVLAGTHQGRGEFSLENHGYMELPLRSMLDDTVKKLVIVKPSKTGGSTIADVCLPYWLTHSPAKTILLTWVGIDQASKHAKEKLYPTLQASGINLPIEKKQTKTGITFPHCRLIVGGPTKGNFEDTDADIVVCDEPHGYPKGRIQMAYNRVLAAERETGFSKFVMISRGSYVKDSLHTWYLNGTQHVHQVPCFGCTSSFAPTFAPSMFIFDASSSLCKTEDGYVYSEIAKTIRMKCPYCGHLHEDGMELKKIWSNSREYKQINAGAANDYHSYTWSPFVVDDWYGIVVQFLNANQEYKESGGRDFEDLIEFRQTRLAEFAYRPKDISPDGEIRITTSVPTSWGENAALRLMAIDVQTVQGCYWVAIRELRKNVDSQMLWYGQVITETDLLHLQEQYQIPPECVMIDIGDSPTTISYPLMSRHDWIGLKGDGVHDYYNITRDNQRAQSFISSFATLNINGKKIRWLNFAKQPICDITNKFLQKKGKVSWLSMNNKEYQKQIRKVRREERDYNRIKRWVWVDDKTAHGWDCENMIVAGCLLHRSKLDILEVVSEYSSLKDVGLHITRTHLPTKKLEFDDAY